MTGALGVDPEPGSDPVTDVLDLPPWSAEQAGAARRLFAAALDNRTLNRIVELAARLLGAASAQVSLLTDVQTAVVGHGLPPGTVGTGVPFADSMCLVAAAGGSTLAIPDTRADARVSRGAKVVTGQIGAYLGVPLVSDAGVTVGSLCVFEVGPRQWTDAEVSLLEQLAASTRAELELAALTREYDTDRARWELAVQASDVGTFDWDLRSGDLLWDDRLIALYGYDAGDTRFDRSIASVDARVHQDDRELVNRSMADAIQAVGAIHVTYRIVVPPGHVRWLEARGRALPDPGDPDGPAVRLLGISWDVTAQQDGEARADRVLASMPLGYLAMDDGWRVTAVNAEGARLARSTPAAMLGRSLWDLHPALRGTEFDDVYRRVAATGITETVEVFHPAPFETWFEVRVTPSLDGLALYFVDVTSRRRTQTLLEQAARHDRSVAQTLQNVLLAELPQPPGVAIAGRYLTAAEADEVGGDWYDAVVQPDGAVTAMIGDVVGHDVAAAATMGQLRAMLRMAAWASRDAPSGLVGQLDRANRDMHTGAVATMAVCRLEPATSDDGARLLRWTNAGHPPPVVVDVDGRVRVLDGDCIDLLVGVVPDVGRHDHVTTIAAGSTLLLYTDGLVETRDAGLDEGIARLCEALTRHHRASTDDLVDAVLAELVGDAPGDDTAVLALRVVGLP